MGAREGGGIYESEVTYRDEIPRIFRIFANDENGRRRESSCRIYKLSSYTRDDPFFLRSADVNFSQIEVYSSRDSSRVRHAVHFHRMFDDYIRDPNIMLLCTTRGRG